MKTRLAAPLLALLALLLVPSGAQAAFTMVVDQGAKTATVTGDDAADTLVVDTAEGVLRHNATGGGFASNSDWDSTAPGVQSIPEGEGYRLLVNTGGGADQVTILTAGIAGVEADLGAGDDLFSGGPTGDDVAGGAGHDRIAGGRGADEMLGGDGNDTLVWNNGDGSDTMDGEGGGFDGVEVNGAPTLGDDFAIRAGEGGRLRLDRTNLGLFNLDIAAATTERVQVNGLGGNDKVETAGSAGVPLGLDGGPGQDRLVGGEAADVLRGGEDNDALIGGAGDDLLAGDQGNDSMSGGEGSDQLVWNNGDGTDTADGDAGFDAMQVNGAGAGDAFAVKPSGDRTQLDRTNLVPFGVSFTAEVLDLNTLGGNDTVGVTDGTAALIDADGGTGDDAITGGSGRDALRGGAGNDTITGGAGSDALEGGDGDDTIGAADGAVDAVGCGAGTDKATLDAGDAAADCETADRAPGGTPKTPGAPASSVVRIATSRVKVAKRRAALKLDCVGTAACAGTVVLSTARSVRIGRARVIVVLGSAKFTIAAGGSVTVKVKLTRALRMIAGRRKSLKARAVAGTVSRGVTLRRGKGW